MMLYPSTSLLRRRRMTVAFLQLLLRVVLALVVVVVVISTTSTTCAATPSPPAEFDGNNVKIAGYWPDYRSLPNDYLSSLYYTLSDLFLFSLEMNGDTGDVDMSSDGDGDGDGDGEDGDGDSGNPVCCIHPHQYQQAKSLATNTTTKTWITIGGAGRTHHWKSVCQDATKRQRFFASVAELCHREGIQGVSLDWFSGMSSQEDFQLFTQCVQEASHFWRQKDTTTTTTNNTGTTTNSTTAPPLQLSVSYYPMQTHPRIWKFVDRIHVMTYGSTGGSTTTSNVQQELTYNLQLLQQAGCPWHKIWLGVPLYAQATRPDLEPPLLTWGEAWTQSSSYATTRIIPTLQAAQEVLKQALEGYQWDTPDILKVKVDMVRRHHLGGLFLWELGQDAFVMTKTMRTTPLLVSSAGLGLTLLSTLASGRNSTSTSTSKKIGDAKARDQEQQDANDEL